MGTFTLRGDGGGSACRDGDTLRARPVLLYRPQHGGPIRIERDVIWLDEELEEEEAVLMALALELLGDE
jgi:hypothetical protein